MENTGNATCLFIQPSRDYHNSEHFWTTFFALYILGSSRSGKELEIPTFYCIGDSGNCKFNKTNEPLKIPRNLDRKKIIVEGKIINQIPDVPLYCRNKFQNISPDIIIKVNKSIIIIEAKTVGSKLGTHKKELYQKLAKCLKDMDYEPQLYFLISAGHEEKTDFNILCHNDNNQRPFPFKILLWEIIFKHLHENLPASYLDRCLGDIEQYYDCEEAYL